MTMVMRIFIPRGQYFDDSKEKIYVETGRHSKKMENLTGNDTIYFCIDDPSPPYKGVNGKGNVKVSYDVTITFWSRRKFICDIWEISNIQWHTNLLMQ